MKQRTMNVTINLKSGEKVTLTGDAAQKALVQLENHKKGIVLERAFSYVDVDGVIQNEEYSCICGWSQGVTTETELPDRECEDICCIKDVPLN